MFGPSDIEIDFDPTLQWFSFQTNLPMKRAIGEAENTLSGDRAGMAPGARAGNVRSVFLDFAKWLHQVNVFVCSTLLAIVFCAQILVVMLRYLFSVGFIELQDVVSYSFAGLCVLALPNALRANAHVRVDIFRNWQSQSAARRIDLAAICLFLIPMFTLIIWYGMPLVSYSWSIFEGSRETGGLPGFFIVLTALPVACLLMIIQAVAIVIDPEIIHDAQEDARDELNIPRMIVRDAEKAP